MSFWTPTKEDLADARMAYNTLHDPCGCMQAPQCMCNLDTVIEVTLGYVDVKDNGDVAYNGHTLFNVLSSEVGTIKLPQGVTYMRASIRPS